MSSRTIRTILGAVLAVGAGASELRAQDIETHPFPGMTYIKRTLSLPPFQCPGCPAPTPNPRLARINIVLIDLTAPEIRFNFLKSANDYHALIQGMRICREIARQPALKPFVVEEILPGPQVTEEADLKADIRARGVSNLHPVGTCRMGREVDAVVDPQLRVYGVERLRVADASIMPSIVAGNTNAPSIMIGEKCADMVRQDAL